MSHSSPKKSSKKNGLIVTNLAQVVPPPAETAPKPPSGFDPSVRRGRGVRPWATLTAVAPKVAEELSASATFGEDFGGKQSAADLSELLTQSAAWRTQRNAASQWFDYVATEDTAAWKVTMRALERFRRAFEYALSCDPSVAARYPQTAEMFRARSAVAVRGAKTRAEKRATEKAKAEGKQPAAPSAPEAAKPEVSATPGAPTA